MVSPRIAVIGGGHLGRIHAKLLSTSLECTLVGVADPSPDSRAIIEKDLKLPTLEDYRQLDGQVDGVVVAAPTFLHHEIGSWALQRGIHTFMEKPIAASSEEAHRLVALAHENQCTLQVGHVERFNPVWTAANSFWKRDSIRYIEAAREGTYTGRSTDIGIVMDLMIHDIDLILSLVQSPVETVQAYGWNVLGKHEDFAMAQLRFRNGTLAQLRASRIAENPKRTMQVYSDEGICHLDFAAGTVVQIDPHSDVASGRRQADDLPAELRSKVKDQLFGEWLSKTEFKPAGVNAISLEHREFLMAITESQSVTVNGHSGAAALSIAMEIVQSIAKGQPTQSIIPSADRFAA